MSKTMPGRASSNSNSKQRRQKAEVQRAQLVSRSVSDLQVSDSSSMQVASQPAVRNSRQEEQETKEGGKIVDCFIDLAAVYSKRPSERARKKVTPVPCLGPGLGSGAKQRRRKGRPS